MGQETHIEQTLNEFKSSGGFKFQYNTGLIMPPPSPIGHDKESFIRHIESKNSSFKISSSKNNYRLYEEYVDAMYSVHADQVPIVGVGGSLGITCRNTSQVESKLPGLTEAINRCKGKVTFLGNGCSDLPLIVADMYQKNIVSSKPIIVDFFDYWLLESDLARIEKIFEEKKYYGEGPWNRHHKCVEQLLQSYDSCNLEIVQYFFGTNSVPSTLKETDLAINCFGPPPATLEEQLSILSPGGQLFCTFFVDKNKFEGTPYKVCSLAEDSIGESSRIIYDP